MKKYFFLTLYLIIVTTLLILAGYYAIHYLSTTWNNIQNSPENICNNAGGFWFAVDSCDNYCEPEKQTYCPDAVIAGCECGLEQCWTGTECIPMTK
ncbi:MAG: hypothetical protein WC730_02975 [Patescibacteria group bacterium]|jgi:hypothetical protein